MESEIQTLKTDRLGKRLETINKDATLCILRLNGLIKRRFLEKSQLETP
jgi:hypothetical protein